jgi:hypothetical protein
MPDVGRREVLTLLGGAAATWPLAARAQQPAMPVVGMLSAEWPNLFSDRLRAFHDGLWETGYAEGRNLAIEYRWAEGRNDRLPALADELVRRQVTVIVSTSTPASVWLRKRGVHACLRTDHRNLLSRPRRTNPAGRRLAIARCVCAFVSKRFSRNLVSRR